MKAAVVTNFNQAPTYQEFDAPIAKEGQVLVDVLAASVNQRVLSQANGSHYTSNHQLPLIPGIDGVGRTQAGQLVYFGATGSVYGALADQTVVDQRVILPLADTVDPAVVAATANPALSSYMAIKVRLGEAKIKNKKVMVLGATGNAGRLAVTISQYFGAKTVIGVGRNAAELQASAADQTINLTDADLKAQLAAVSDVDVVLDYLWGDVTRQVMMGILTQRHNHAQPLDWVEIGSLAGSEMAFPSAALRSTALTVVGSGQGSLALPEMLGQFPGLLKLIEAGTLAVPVTAAPLKTVHENWPTATTDRLVFRP